MNHCVKESLFGVILVRMFPAISRGKMRTGIIPNKDTFHAVNVFNTINLGLVPTGYDHNHFYQVYYHLHFAKIRGTLWYFFWLKSCFENSQTMHLKRPTIDVGACDFIKKETLEQVFFCKFCEIFKNAFFYRLPQLWLLNALLKSSKIFENSKKALWQFALTEM